MDGHYSVPDIDESAMDHAKVICSNGTKCVNTEGSFYCEYKHKARLVIIGMFLINLKESLQQINSHECD